MKTRPRLASRPFPPLPPWSRLSGLIPLFTRTHTHSLPHTHTHTSRRPHHIICTLSPNGANRRWRFFFKNGIKATKVRTVSHNMTVALCFGVSVCVITQPAGLLMHISQAAVTGHRSILSTNSFHPIVSSSHQSNKQLNVFSHICPLTSYKAIMLKGS